MRTCQLHVITKVTTARTQRGQGGSKIEDGCVVLFSFKCLYLLLRLEGSTTQCIYPECEDSDSF